jgi:Uri superfamily endonuclease
LKGVYVLIINVTKDIKVTIGALGKIEFKKGMYAYVGSAQKGLENRVKRHLNRLKKRNFWHIDYLLENNFTEVHDVFYKIANKSMECKIAKNLMNHANLVKNFGSSDCNCKSHLFKINDYNVFRNSVFKMKNLFFRVQKI